MKGIHLIFAFVGCAVLAGAVILATIQAPWALLAVVCIGAILGVLTRVATTQEQRLDALGVLAPKRTRGLRDRVERGGEGADETD